MNQLEKIRQVILNINFFLIEEIKQLDEIIIVEYNTSNLYLLIDILKNGNYGKISHLEPVLNLFGEYIYVYRFSDESDRFYYAMIYDPTGLCQKLTVLEMFRYIAKGNEYSQ